MKTYCYPHLATSCLLFCVLAVSACEKPMSHPYRSASPVKENAGSPVEKPEMGPGVKPSFGSTGIDVETYRSGLVSLVSLYNGGTSGDEGSGVYTSSFDGYFRSNLNQTWQQVGGERTSSVAQSRWIFMNATAYQAAGGGAQAQPFLTAASKGAAYLVENYKDKTYGGYYFKVAAGGQVTDDQKQDFGNCQPVLAMASVYQAEHQAWQLNEALAQVELFYNHFSDPGVSGGFAPSFVRDFSSFSSNRFRNCECITHMFEALLVLHDVAADGERAPIDEKIVKLGEFITHKAIPSSNTNRRYFAYFFDNNWLPSQVPLSLNNMYSGSGWVSIGHTFEMAFLLSRAVERGFDPNWLETAEGLMRFAIDFGFDAKGGGAKFLVDYAGKPYPRGIDPTAGTYEWWPQCEAARALLHFAVARGHDDFLPLFKAQESFIQANFIDQNYGGWFGRIVSDHSGGYRPQSTEKSNIWQDGYHETMFYAEVLRLSATYP